MQRMRRFAKYWDQVGNSGNFITTLPLLLEGVKSPFERFLELSDWLYTNLGASDGVALMRMSQLLFTFLTERLSCHPAVAAQALWHDYTHGRTADQAPAWLAQHLPKEQHRQVEKLAQAGPPARQRRHQAKPG